MGSRRARTHGSGFATRAIHGGVDGMAAQQFRVKHRPMRWLPLIASNNE